MIGRAVLLVSLNCLVLLCCDGRERAPADWADAGNGADASSFDASRARDASRPDSQVGPDASPTDLQDADFPDVADAGPTIEYECEPVPSPARAPDGWREMRSEDGRCVYYVPGSQAALPPPTRWVPCSFAPAPTGCLQAKEDGWKAMGGWPEIRVTRDPSTGSPLLGYPRWEKCTTLTVTWIIERIDGPVLNALQTAGAGPCGVHSQSVQEGRFAYSMRMRNASREYKYDLKLGEMAAIWRGGCIIRAQFLNRITDAFRRDADLPNLLLDEGFRSDVGSRQESLRYVIQTATTLGIPVLALSSALAYFDAYRTDRLPANLTQAQRDYFGAHTYQRLDKPGAFHTEWLE